MNKNFILFNITTNQYYSGDFNNPWTKDDRLALVFDDMIEVKESLTNCNHCGNMYDEETAQICRDGCPNLSELQKAIDERDEKIEIKTILQI